MTLYYPDHLLDLLAGMAETSGLTYDQHLILNIAAEQLGSLVMSGCCGIAAWGPSTPDGSLVFGRNWDFDRAYTKYAKYLTFAIYHPDGSGNRYASIQWAGAVYTESGMNDRGIFLELNNGIASDTNSYPDRVDATVQMDTFLLDSTSMDHLDALFNSTRPNLSYLIQAANSNVAYSYEWPTFGVRRRSETNYPGLLVAVNTFVDPFPDPSWTNWATPRSRPGSLDWRRTNLLALATSTNYRGQINVSNMMAIMDTSVLNGGATMTNPPNLDQTVYQIIAVPQDQHLWLRAIGYSDWEKVDLRPLFGE